MIIFTQYLIIKRIITVTINGTFLISCYRTIINKWHHFFFAFSFAIFSFNLNFTIFSMSFTGKGSFNGN